MRKAGFYIKTVEESCERFAVIDQEVVWYGNINLLAKDKVDDSIMRVLSKEIASELMELRLEIMVELNRTKTCGVDKM